ncbi:MAG: acyl-CoA thioester hydrolase/BAAT C-terminal domain-containing protein [Bacteroidota bacterium]
MEKIQPDDYGEYNTYQYWLDGIPADSTNHPGFIPVEQISGPVVLISGKDDQLWPSSFMANQIERRLKKRGFPFPVFNLQYEDSGHLISGNPDHQVAPGSSFYYVEKEKVDFQFGGSAEGDLLAKRAARDFILSFDWKKEQMSNE